MKTKKYTLADGRAVRLTPGEVRAFRRHIAMNGRSTEQVQYDPGHVRYDTLRNLVEKGLFTRDDRGLYFLAPGVVKAAGQ